jgi:hypothetical protein
MRSPFAAANLVALAALAAAPALAQGADADARYQVLLAKAVASDPTATDWGALRYAYAGRPGYAPDAGAEAETKMLTDFNKRDCQAALADAHAINAGNFVEPDAHLLAAICEDQLGHAEAAARELGVGMGLITSIEASGDGSSAAKAMEVISVSEEYSVMRVKSRQVTRQALVTDGGHNYDVLTTVGDKGDAQTYYFRIDRVLAAEAAALKPGSVSEGGPPR